MTLVFAEHVHDDDEVHIAYNAMQSGWRNHPPEHQDGTPHTELFFEYSALIVVRRRRRECSASSATPSGPSSSASTADSEPHVHSPPLLRRDTSDRPRSRSEPTAPSRLLFGLGR